MKMYYLILSLFSLLFLFASCTDENFTGNTGEITFWTNKPTTSGINIYIEGALEGTLDYYFLDFTPECAESGTVTVSLEPGLYNYTAVQPSLYQWSGSFTIVKNTCVRELLD